MAGGRSKAKAEADRLLALGEQLRDAALTAYVYHNPHGKRPGWAELCDWSKEAWTAVVKAIVKHGWRPPDENWRTFVEGIIRREKDLLRDEVKAELKAAGWTAPEGS